MTDSNFEGLLDRLRRQSTLSQEPGVMQQQPQQQGYGHGHMYHPPSTEPMQQPQFHPDQALHQHSQHSTPGIPSAPENPSPGFPLPHQLPNQLPTPPHTQPPEPTQQGNQATPASSAQPQSLPYNPPMSPSSDHTTANRTASLLQLLKFSQAPTSSESPVPPSDSPSPRPPVASPPPAAPAPPVHNRTISASDLVASLFGRPTPELPNAGPQSGAGKVTRTASTSPVQPRTAPEPVPPREKSQVNPQDLVFQLLGRSKPAQDERSSPAPASAPEGEEPKARSSGEHSRASSSKPATPESRSMPAPPPLQGPSAAPQASSGGGSKGMFTYVNPFEQIHATSPRNKTPRASTPHNVARKSNLSMGEMKAENIPLPFSPSPASASKPETPLAAVEADAAKEAATLDQVKQKEHEIMDNGHVTPDAEHPVAENAQGVFGDEAMADAQVEKPESEKGIPAPAQETNGDHAIGEKEIKDEEAYESASETSSIEVYNFPMKPFSAITIIPSAIKRPKYPMSKIADIAKMSRTFDQLDRNLMAASHKFIVYSISKSNGRGGIRVIRQLDGKDRIMNKDSTDKTFNVTIGRGERILATSVSGAVVWVDLKADFDSAGWDSMFVFPPSEEQGQSNGVLKSRARKTSRHADVFAIGRGKTISIIHAPAAKAYAQGRKGNEVASKKYLAEHARTIDTGKASKDFAFSDDDTVIISIDKAGKLKLWDVQPLLDFSQAAYNPITAVYPPQPPMVLSYPMIVFSAVAAGESYRATSVMFLDKFRPYHKCLALRYVIVGMKQNHTLQLWDLALGRPVQEINFPQQSDTDALCSVVYHPLTGIIVVGNPTRNSIYFIHLSAPKYNLPPMSQAQYINGLANKDASIPKPDATAILSGLREYSFASKGQLMSVDILDVGETEADSASPALFELFVAHSKGMTILSVYKEDLGWEADNRVRNPVDAVERGVCTLSSLPPHPPQEREKEKEEKNEMPETAATPGPGLKPETNGKPTKSRSVSPAARGSEKPDVAEPAANNTGKKKKKEKASSIVSPQTTATPEPVADEAKTADKGVTNGKGKAPTVATASEQELNIGISSSFLDREVKRFEKTVNTTFDKQLEQLYRRIDEDRMIQTAASDAKQEAVLRLLSTTLTENVEQVISRIVVNNIQGQVVPAIADITAASVDRRLNDSLTRSLGVSLPAELRNIIPEAVNRTLGQADLLNRISDSLIRPLSQAVEREFNHTLQQSIVPAFQKLAIDTANKTVLETERRHNDAIASLENQRKQDSQKIDQLMVLVHGLSKTMNAMAKTQADMAKAQSDFQEHVRQAEADYRSYEQSTQAPQAPQPPEPPHKTPEQLEAEEIENLLRSGKYEDGTIKWLQSKERQAELFDEVMVRYRYDFLPNLSQLVLLSVSAAVSVKFEHKVMERLSWLEGVLAVLDPEDPEIREICHRIMVVVVQRLEQLYMNTAERNNQNPILRKIPNIARRARELSALSS